MPVKTAKYIVNFLPPSKTHLPGRLTILIFSKLNIIRKVVRYAITFNVLYDIFFIYFRPIIITCYVGIVGGVA